MQASLGIVVLSILALCICMHLVKCDQIPDAPTCVFSVPNNKTLFETLAKFFDKDSNTIIVEYTLRIRNVSDDFNFYEKSSPGSFQPWKWYRTQGVGSSHVLLTFDFCFGLLRQLLYLGIKKVDIDLDVSPPGCLHNIENNSLDILIRNFLLQDLYIQDTSYFRDCALSDSIEICTARIGGGKLMFRCCSYNSDKEILCDDDYVDIWANGLNIVICILSCLLVVYYLIMLLHHHGSNIVDIPQQTLDGMKNFKEEIKDKDKKEIYKVTVKKTSIKMSCHRLLNEYDEQDSLLIAWTHLLLPGCCCCLKDEEAGKKWPKAWRTFFLMIMIILPSTWFICAMVNHNSWYRELIVAFRERGLQGPFYFQWALDSKDQEPVASTFVALNLFGAVVIIFTHTFRKSSTKLKYIRLFIYCVFIFVLLLDAIFLISLFVMLVFTAIVEVKIWNILVQIFLTLLVYVRVYFQEFWSGRVAMKSLLLNLFKSENRFNGESTVSRITAESLDSEFKKLKIDYNCGEASGSSSEIELKAEATTLNLQLNGTLLFLNKFDVPSITQNFFDHCLKLDVQGGKRCTLLTVLRIVKPLVWPPMLASLVVISIMAYGDLYHISLSNRFFASFVTIIVPLVVQHFKPGESSRKSIYECNRRFQRELRNAINEYKEDLDVEDITESVIRPATTEEKDTKLNRLCRLFAVVPEPSSSQGSGSNEPAQAPEAPPTRNSSRHPSVGSVPPGKIEAIPTDQNV